MKLRILLILLILSTLSLSRSFGQNRFGIKEIEKKHILKINLLSPFLGTISLQHEKIINNESSFQSGIYYFSGLVLNTQNPVKAICLTTEYRYYLVDEAPNGAYIQPFFRVGRYWEDNNFSGKLGSNLYGVAVGILIGHQWIIVNKFAVDLYAGPIFTKPFLDNSAQVNIRDLPVMVNGYWLRAGFTVGYYF